MEKSAYYIICIFTILQLLILHTFGYTPYPDSEGYTFLAKECIEAGYIVYPIPSLDYPFIWNLGAINAVVFSLKLFSSVTPLLYLYAFFKGITVLLFYLFTKKITCVHTALTALIIYVTYPANYGECTSLLSELPFVFFVFLAVWLITNKEKNFTGGMVLAIANTIRPMGLVFIAAYIVWFLCKRSSARKKIAHLLAGYSFVILSIGAFNYVRSGYFFYQTVTGWMALMQYSWDNDMDKSDDIALFDHADPMYTDSSKHYNSIQKDSIYQAHFFVWLANNKAEYVRQMPKKLFATYISDNTNICTFLPDKTEREYMYEPLSMNTLFKNFPILSAVQWLAIANLVYYYIIILLATLSTILLIRIRRIKYYIFCISSILIGTVVILLVGHGESRFHQPLMPFFIILAATYIQNKRYPLQYYQKENNPNKR